MQWQLWLTIISVLQLGTIYGIEMVYVAYFLDSAEFKHHYGELGDGAQGLMTAILPISAMAGSITMSLVASKISRKKAMSASFAVWIVGYQIASFALTYPAFIGCRAARGFALGVLTPTIPLYIKDVFNLKQASTVITCYQCAAPFGVLVFAVVASVVMTTGKNFNPDKIPSFAWCWIISGVSTYTLPVTLYFMRTSPRDCVVQIKEDDEGEVCDGKLRDAVRALSEDVSDYRELMQFYEQEIKRQKIKPKFGSLNRLLSDKQVRSRLGRSVLMQVMAGCSGVVLIMYYFTVMCNQLQVSPEWTKNLNTMLQTGNFFACMLAIVICRDQPRLLIMRFGYGLLTFFFGLLFFISYASEKDVTSAMPPFRGFIIALFILLCLLFTTFISTSTLLFVSEVIPLSVRDTGMCISLATQWLVNFLIAQLSPALISKLGCFTFLLFCLINGADILLTMVFQETHGLNENSLLDLYG